MRLPEGTKAVIERAAASVGVTLTDFVVSAAENAAYRRVLGNAVVTVKLNREDSLRLAEALSDPAVPTDALRSMWDALCSSP